MSDQRNGGWSRAAMPIIPLGRNRKPIHRQEETPQKRHARTYAKLGWFVLPVYPVGDKGHCTCSQGTACRSPGKHPMTANGLNDATTDLDQIGAWFDANPDANVGIRTGGDLLVLDIDPRNGGEETLQNVEAQLGALPPTVEAHTGGGGYHLFFQHPDFEIRKDNRGKLIGPGVDVMSEGAFVVVPQSRHRSGRLYRWARGRRPTDLQPASLSAAWRDRLRGHAGPRKAPQAESGAPAATAVILEGQRNVTLCSKIGQLHRAGLSPDAILAAALEENRLRCAPPLDEAEVEKIVQSVLRYPNGGAASSADPAEQVMRLVLDQHYAGGNHLLYATDGQFWAFDGRKWAPQSEKWLKGRILDAVRSLPDPNRRNSAGLLSQVVQLLEAQQAVNDDRLRFRCEPPPVINCQNGELWIGNDGAVELRPHSPESYLRHCLDVAYDPEACCPVYDQTLADIFEKARDAKAMVRQWHELVGYIIQPSRKIPLILILKGSGSNGKTQLMATVTRLLGNELVLAVNVDDLGQRFMDGALLGKLLVLDDDVKAFTRLSDGILKKISERKLLTGEHKYGNRFQFMCLTVPVLLCNNSVSLSDVSRGMTRRLVVVPFGREFTEGEDDDRDLFPRIWASELPGILNRAIAGFQRVVQRGYRVTQSADSRQAKEDFIRDANPLPGFIQECCEVAAAQSCWMKEFYPAYCDWAERTGIKLKQQQRHVKQNLVQLGYQVEHRNQGDRVFGLRLKTSGYEGASSESVWPRPARR